jgi:hypothetical protein
MSPCSPLLSSRHLLLLVNSLPSCPRSQSRHPLLSRFPPLRVEEVGLTLKASKCKFHTDRTEYLSYIIAPTGISMDPEKVKVVEEWRDPTNVKGVQSFLGFANFYRRFIRDFSKITTPLTKLTWKDRPWEWNDIVQAAFEQLKVAMISQPIP